MSWTTGFRARLRQWLDRDAIEERMDEEIRFHIEMETEKNVRAGMVPEEARRRAVLAFGGMEKHREQMREERRVPLVEELWRDVRYALRSLGRTRAFTAAAILTLALGVGTNAAVFGLLSATLLRPLPFPESERLVALHQRALGSERESRPIPWSYPEFSAVRSAVTTLAHAAAYHSADVNLSGTGGDPARIRMEMVSASYFPALKVQPALGRAFLPEEDSVPGAHPVALLGHTLWTGRFGAKPEIVGERILLNGVALTVVGVMPEGFRGLTGEGEVWIPHAMAPQVYFPSHLTTGENFLSVVARLRPGTPLEQARAEVSSSGARAAAAARQRIDAGEERRWEAVLLPLEEARRDPAALRAQAVLSGAVFFVLLIAAANLSGLMLARSVGRAREMAVRTAIGAGRRRLLRQLLVEGGVIGLSGGALSVMIAVGSIHILARFAPERLGGSGSGFRRLDPFSAPEADWRIVLFAGVLALATGLFSALVPALRATRGDLTRALKSGARGSSVGVGSLRRPTVLSWVAVAQVACALVLLVGAGMLLQGFHRLRSLDLGLDAAGVVTFQLTPPESAYGGPGAAALLQRVLERVESIPGVASASIGRCLPGTGCSTAAVYLSGRPEPDRPLIVRRHYVGPDHLRTLGIPLRRGRGITATDRPGRPRVAVINETAARHLWPGEDPIGKRVWFGSGGGFASPDSLTEIVGVVGDVRYGEPGDEVRPDFYTSYLQFVLPATLVMARTTGDPTALVPALRHAVKAVDPNLPIHSVRTVKEVRAESLAEERFATIVLGTFAGLGLLLASVGVYGVMAYSVAQRRREIGIRLALGATPREVVRFVVRQGVALTTGGLLLGAVSSLGLAPALPALISGIGGPDPRVFAGVALALLLVAVLTCYLPARAAARVDPVEVLATE